MSDWREWSKQGIVNRNYHVLSNLLKREEIGKILAIDFLPHTKIRALKSYVKNQLLVSDDNLIKSDLTSKFYKINEKLFGYTTIDTIFKNSEDKICQKINKLISHLDLSNVIIWSYLPTFVGYYEELKAKLKVFDTVDNWIKHPNYKSFRGRLKKNYKRIEENADLIFTVSENLKELFPSNNDVHWIPNGVDVNHFQQLTISNKQSTISSFKRPIIGYAGIIQDRIDMELVSYLANRNQDKSFIFIGMVWPDANLKEVEKLENIHFLGHKSYNELPPYIHQFDAAIIPHKINEFTLSMNPLKLYEYLACGKPVVTTPIAGTEEFRGLIEITGTKEEFNQKIQEVLSDDNKNSRIRRVEAVKQHSWDSRIDQMFNYVNQSLS
jgi:glycosyltransferase involved in cell wall biosynthesis